MTPAEVERLLDGADTKTPEGRQELRDRLLRLRLAQRVGTAAFNDALKAVDGNARDLERPKSKTAPPLVVEVQRFGVNGSESTP